MRKAQEGNLPFYSVLRSRYSRSGPAYAGMRSQLLAPLHPTGNDAEDGDDSDSDSDGATKKVQMKDRR
jgi:hypothetical protein